MWQVKFTLTFCQEAYYLLRNGGQRRETLTTAGPALGLRVNIPITWRLIKPGIVDVHNQQKSYHWRIEMSKDVLKLPL